MPIANDSFEPLESACETFWDRVLRMCDEWFPYEPARRRKTAYDKTILDSTLTISLVLAATVIDEPPCSAHTPRSGGLAFAIGENLVLCAASTVGLSVMEMFRQPRSANEANSSAFIDLPSH